MRLLRVDRPVSEYVQQAALVEILRVLLLTDVMPEYGGALSEFIVYPVSDNKDTTE